VIPILQTGEQCNLVSGGESILRSIRLKYSYLGVFRKTQELSIPAAVGMVCSNPQQVVARMFGP
jgi:hypothetical protein